MFEIFHINHSSLLIRSNSSFLLTDPWIISSAFGSWTQNPYPLAKHISFLLNIPPDNLSILISHGHDDHIDDFFIKKHFYKSQILIPKLSNPGFKNRVSKISNLAPIEIDGECYYSGMKFNCFNNLKLSNSDTIISIDFGSDLVIHANDNWHVYDDHVINNLLKLSSHLNKNNIHYFVQFGIADSYPLSYKMSTKQKSLIIQNRFKNYSDSINMNIFNLKTINNYYYANQSSSSVLENSSSSFNLYHLTVRYLDKHVPFLKRFNNPNIIDTNDNIDFLNYLLIKLSNFVNKRIMSNITIIFSVNHNRLKIKSNHVIYASSPFIWSQIFTGVTTLESLTIGNQAVIYKSFDLNIREIHHKISNLAYFIQHSINTNGLNFLLDE